MDYNKALRAVTIIVGRATILGVDRWASRCWSMPGGRKRLSIPASVKAGSPAPIGATSSSTWSKIGSNQPRVSPRRIRLRLSPNRGSNPSTRRFTKVRGRTQSLIWRKGSMSSISLRISSSRFLSRRRPSWESLVNWSRRQMLTRLVRLPD